MPIEHLEFSLEKMRSGAVVKWNGFKISTSLSLNLILEILGEVTENNQGDFNTEGWQKTQFFTETTPASIINFFSTSNHGKGTRYAYKRRSAGEKFSPSITWLHQTQSLKGAGKLVSMLVQKMNTIQYSLEEIEISS